MAAYSQLQQRLAAGQIVVTGELAPPRGASRAVVERLAGGMRHAVDAINLTDNQRGLGRMSALGGGIIVQQLGIEPIVQMTCQHRNRIALQADVLSGAACGVPNFLCMTGDHPKIGDHPDAKNVLDLNSFQLIKMLRGMRDQQQFHSGVALSEAPRFFLGGVANPNIEKIARLERKIQFGAEFIQTQIVFDVPRFRQWMADARVAGLHQQAYILAGIMIIKSAASARFLRDHLPGSRIPEWVIARMEQAAQPETEGIAIAADLTRELLSIDGVRGVHIMSVGWTKAIPHVIERAGLLPRPPLPRAEGRE
ncbi:MAG TPA: methylenetetrahydrofolate reductase [Roseiflexaceae bacterium]|nr:methylenetetrahydrofolate reductase [Roseiflexaceae bacterium]